MIRIVGLIHLLLIGYLMYDCYSHRREPFWYLVLLIPFWGVAIYIYRFKF